MTQNYWFKANKKGIGWTPNGWQGWIVLVVYVIFLIHSFMQVDGRSHSVSDTLINYFPRFLIFTALLTIITYLKGEPTTWSHETAKSSEEKE